jgi:rod shape determining protein RodA
VKPGWGLPKTFSWEGEKAMGRIKTSRFTSFDVSLVVVLFAIGLLGILTLYSSTLGGTSAGGMEPHQKQLIWWGLGLVCMLATVLIDYRHFEHYAYLIYACSLILLAYVLGMGRSISGARRWIEVGPVQFQPSELIKITMTFALAKYFHHHGKQSRYNLFELAIPFLIFATPFVLVLLEPDLGTAILLLLVFFSIVLFLGISRGSIVVLMVTGLASLPLGWASLKDYQRDRVLTFLNPSEDPLGKGYHIIQSKIAIGSGGFWGKGFLAGTQTRLNFLPEQHTDFIFSAFAEQWGFLGSVLLAAGYVLVILWALNICSRAKNTFGMVLALGVTFLFFWHVSINIGMCLGLLPVVGIPLPLFSYGGSFLLAMLCGLGLLLNISIRRFVF